MADVSIVIVSWNARDYLLRALESIAVTVQRHTCQVIVVDNASSDGSPEAVEARFPEARLIRNGANLGFAKANNVGIRTASGRLVALVNSDVTLLPDCLDRLIDFMDGHPRAGMTGPRVLNLDGTLQHSHWAFPSVGGALRRTLALDTLAQKVRSTERGARKEEARARGANNAIPTSPSEGMPVDVLSGCFVLLRREALASVGLLDENFYIYGEDMDLCRRFHEAGWQVQYYPEACAIHAGGASSANAPIRFFLELQKANLHYWTKHHGRAGRLFFLVNTFIHHLLRLLPGVIIYLVLPPKRNTISPKIKRSAACMKWIVNDTSRSGMT